MNIYKVSQNINDGYDTYDSFVVASNTADEAKYTNPSDDVFWNDGRWVRKNPYNGDIEDHDTFTWCHPDHVKVEIIGVTDLYNEKIVILTSFNAG